MKTLHLRAASLRALLAILVLTSTSFAAQSPPGDAPPLGIVTRADGKTPIAGAEVILRLDNKTTAGSVFIARTGDDGVFGLIEPLAPGNYTVDVRKDMNLICRQTIDLARETRPLHLLAAAGSLSGKVTGVDAKPAAGVAVALVDPGRMLGYRATSGLDGSYTIPHVLPGRYRAIATTEYAPDAAEHSVALHDDVVMAADPLTADFELKSRPVATMKRLPVADADLHISAAGVKIEIAAATLTRADGSPAGAVTAARSTTQPSTDSLSASFSIQPNKDARDQDLTARITLKLKGAKTDALVVPRSNGVIATIPATQPARYVLGRGSAGDATGDELALPLIGVKLSAGDRLLSVAADPYCGVRFDARGDEITVTTTYPGSIVRTLLEHRTLAIALIPDEIPRLMDSFYASIPEIQPGPAWLHDVGIVYYDYLSENGQGWYADLRKLADKIPPGKRSGVAVCVHGWYDYLFPYTFDSAANALADQWTAFPNTRKTPMSKAEMHKRISFARELGFHPLLYFGTALLADSGAPGFPKDWIFRDESGQAQISYWQGPDTIGKNHVLDPAHPGVVDWHDRYLAALIDEYGKELDGFVWDETFYIPAEQIETSLAQKRYADRAMMKLVAQLSMRVQHARSEINPNLVFMTSDDIGMAGFLPGHDHIPPYALVAHGTYQDSHCNPKGWAPGLLPNWRNVLWSCNWQPVTNAAWNKIAAEDWGVPQGLSNGWADDKGPGEMDEKLLDEVIARFLSRDPAKRVRFLPQ